MRTGAFLTPALAAANCDALLELIDRRGDDCTRLASEKCRSRSDETTVIACRSPLLVGSAAGLASGLDVLSSVCNLWNGKNRANVGLHVLSIRP